MEKNKELIIYILLFFIISMPFTYNITNKLLYTLDKQGCPTYLSIFLHTIIYGVFIYFIKNNELQEKFAILKQEPPKICDTQKNNCPKGYSCLHNYNFCEKSNELPLCKSGHARCFKKCYNRNLRSGDHDCASGDNCWNIPGKGGHCSYQDYVFNT